MSRTRKKTAVAEVLDIVDTDKIVSANYRIAQPFGGGPCSTRRYHLSPDELDSVEIMVEACNEVPALRALAIWADEHGAPEHLLEALESARRGARWAIEGRPQPEDWRPYRAARSNRSESPNGSTPPIGGDT